MTLQNGPVHYTHASLRPVRQERSVRLYVCKSLIRLGKGACKTPRFNARRFERLIVDRIRSSILTEGNNGDLTKAVVQEVDRLTQEQRKLLETIESEVMDAHRRLERLFELLETSERRNSERRPAGSTPT